MYFKFLSTPAFSNKLKSYKGDYDCFWIPASNSREAHSYVKLDQQDFGDFLNHFNPEDGQIIDDHADELPESILSGSANNGQRVFNFIISKNPG